MQEIQANTEIKVRMGPFIDVTNGFTPETGITLGAADEAELLKTNGAATVDISARTWAAVTACDGWYDLTLTTTDTNTEGQLTVVVQDDSVCLPVHCHFMVLAQAAYISKYTAKDSGFMDVNVKAVSEDTAASDNLESACDNYSVTRGLSGTALPAAAADAAGGLPISDAGGLALDTQLANTNEVTAARMGALTDWINGGRLDLILDIIAADTTTDIPALIATAQADLDTITGASGVVIQDGTITNASLNADIGSTAYATNKTALAGRKVLDELNLDHLMKVATAAADMTTEIVDNSAMSRVLASGDTSAFDPTTDSLQDIRDKSTDIETDTNELQGDWTNGGRLDLILDTIAADTTTDIPALIATAQADLDTITGASGVVIQDGTITNASLNADVGSTAYATNKVALAGRKVLDEIKLDHLVAVADTDDPVNNSIMAKIAASDGDWSGFDNSTDSLEAIRDRGDADWSSGGATNPNMLLEAEIATVTDQTHFTLATGSDINDAYNDQAIVIYDDSNSDYPSTRVVNDYVGVSKTITLDSAPVFTMGADDSIRIFVTAPGSTAPTVGQIRTEMDDNSTQFTAIVADTNELQTDWTNGGRLDLLLDAIPTTAMRGTDGANTTVPDAAGVLPTAVEVRTEMDSNSTQFTAIVADTNELQTDWTNGGRLDNLLDAIPTTAMRGTDGANTTVPDAAGVAPTATEIVDEWESQSQTDPTGFHVNVKEVNGTSQTANDNSADINAILVDTAEIGAAGAGLTNINLPNQTMDITGNLSGSVGSVTGDVGITAAAIDSIFDEVFEGALTFRQGLRLFLAVLAGKSAGGGTATLTMQDNGDTKARITATVDANGNRTAMTLDGA